MSTEPSCETRFKKVVRQYGIAKLAVDLNVDSKAIYQWLQGIASPRPEKAMRMIVLVRSVGRLELEDIYQHRFITRAVLVRETHVD
jgi:hypothetical protein